MTTSICLNELTVTSPCKYPVEAVRSILMTMFECKFMIDEKLVLDVGFKTKLTPPIMEVVELAEKYPEFKFELTYKKGDGINHHLMTGAI